MRVMFGFEKLTKVDNRLNAIFGYRQSINIAVAAVACFALYYGMYETSAIIFLLAFKWYMSQVYHNIDAVEVLDMGK